MVPAGLGGLLVDAVDLLDVGGPLAEAHDGAAFAERLGELVELGRGGGVGRVVGKSLGGTLKELVSLVASVSDGEHLCDLLNSSRHFVFLF